jgi:glycerophosphoryl diester phosphodiesterase
LRIHLQRFALDTHVTEDEKVVVSHDRQISGAKRQDTGPAFPGDPEFPYVGDFITDLTLAQVKMLKCGYQALPDFPNQEVASGPMIELRDVFDLVKSYKAKKLKLNIETKVEAGAPQETAPRETFVLPVWEEIRDAGMADQVTIQSFDWGALMEMHRLAPDLPLVALTNRDFLQIGQPGKSPWLGGIDVDDFGGNFVAAAASIEGVTALSPVQGFPQNGVISNPSFVPYPDPQMIADAHAPRSEGDPLDDRRPGDDGLFHRAGRRRDHHELSQSAPRGDGGQGHAPPEGVQAPSLNARARGQVCSDAPTQDLTPSPRHACGRHRRGEPHHRPKRLPEAWTGGRGAG